MTIEPLKPVLLQGLDWAKVTHFSVTLEKPFKNGGLRFRYGTSEAKKNLNFNAHDDNSGPPYWPGQPIMYPEDAPAIAGDKERETFIMPAEAAFMCFGFFFAPLEVPKKGLIGFTLSNEKERVAGRWQYYRMPPGDGTMHPPMNRLGPPLIPHVALRPLDNRFRPIKIDGQEIVIRPREFFDYDNPANYDVVGAGLEGFEEDKNKAAALRMIDGLSSEELDLLRELLKERRGKVKA